TGITEPIEFTFLFVAPALYGIHCVFAGAAYMFMHMLGVGVGMTFSGGIIDLILFGVLPGNKLTSWVWVPVVGVGYFIVYYFLFTFLIKKFDLKTPGRDADEEVKLYRRADYNAKKESMGDQTSEKICNGLGGKANISDVDCCATRLRVTVHKSELVNDAMLKSTGASGVVHKGNGVQVIYGPHVTVIKSNLEDYLETAPNVEYNGAGETVADEAAASTSAEPTGEVVKTVVLGSPISGVAADLAETPDEVFAQKMMGDGAVVTPNDGKVVAPADGTVVFVFDTKHAIGFKTDDDVAMLLHFGIDTVKLKGEGFNVHVTNGQKVKKGDLLMEADLDYISKNAPSIATPVLCTELKGNQKLRRLADGEIKAGEDLLAVDFYE
ncbi:MAG: PTS glucose transporter subunit IIA, partial [Pseudobutyrivibrio sp.]|nr:PTS glucose transporter subunit IIA [Pseudobutyrivibrio sp.]